MQKSYSSTKHKVSARKLHPLTSQEKQHQASSIKETNQSNIQFRQQNMKDFKVEIDHEIAKCLDTLDRQGLKYLKETLRSSLIFNTDDVNQKQLVGEDHEQSIDDKKQQKPKRHPKFQQMEDQIPQDYDICEEIQQNIATNGQGIEEQIPQTINPKLLENCSNVKIKQPIKQPLKPFSKRPSSVKLKEQNFETEPKNKSEIDILVQRISNLSKEKLKKLGKIIEKLEKPQQLESSSTSFQARPYIFTITDKSKSRDRPGTVKSKKKVEKATSLYDPIMKGKKKEVNEERISTITEQNSSQFSQNKQKSQEKQKEDINQEIEGIQEQIEEVKEKQKQKEQQSSQIKQKIPTSPTSQNKIYNAQQKLSSKPEPLKKSGFMKNFPLSSNFQKKSLHIESAQSVNIEESSMSKTENKFLKVGKKKLGTNKLVIVLLKSRGNPNIIGLTSIEIYNSFGKKMQISLQQIKKPLNSVKVQKLFNGINFTNNQQHMFIERIVDSIQIQLEITQKIGALKVWNFNKSKIESDKQTELIQIWINDKREWKGEIKHGSYNQLEDYHTPITIDPQFSFLQQKSMTESFLMREKQEKNKVQKIKEGVNFALPQIKEKQKKESEWLEKTLVERQIKELQEEDKQVLPQNRKPIRNSIYKEEQKKQTNIEGYFSNKNQSCLRKQPKGQQIIPEKKSIRIVKKTHQPSRFEDEIDIFGSLNQKNFSNLKQKEQQKQVKNIQTNNVESRKSRIVERERLQQAQVQKVAKKVHQRSMDDFMNDSLFQDVPKKTRITKKIIDRAKQKIQSIPKEDKMEKVIPQSKEENVNLDDFINELNDVVGTDNQRKKYKFGNERNKQIVIPELPKGIKMQICLIENWGDTQYIGLNKIELFDEKGQRVFPVEIKTNPPSASSLLYKMFSTKPQPNSSQEQYKTEQKDIRVFLSFKRSFELSMMRIWNYHGDRIHSNIGVKKIQVLFDGFAIFVGQVKKSTGKDDFTKNCEHILFTNNVIIQKRIKENDWLAYMIRQKQQEKVIFQKTLESFIRPITKEHKSQQIKDIQQEKFAVKLPKRPCFEYDPPAFPSGYYLKILLHKTWGDRDFIGLNGIIIFDENGDKITQLASITDFPLELRSLPGYEEDKRQVKNLLSPINHSSAPANCWLAPYQTDLQKIENKTINMVIITFHKPIRLGGINFYNYTKHPERGVRELQIQIDNWVVYKGYLRIAKDTIAEKHTTINFTKDLQLLEKMNYIGYHEDNIEQNVTLINEGKFVKS